MGFAETVLLGGIAGSTIYIGLPFGRIEHVDDRVRVALAMFSVGILAFIFMDVSSSAENLVSSALTSFKHHHAGFGSVLGRFAVLAAGFTLGAAGISFAERRVHRRSASSRGVVAGGSSEGVSTPALDPVEA